MQNKKFDPDARACPECNANWRDSLIPGTSRHYSRLIGVELPYGHPERYDGVSIWQCPDCAAQWNRFTGKLITNEKS